MHCKNCESNKESLNNSFEIVVMAFDPVGFMSVRHREATCFGKSLGLSHPIKLVLYCAITLLAQ
jgi:hypothetical protein